MKLYQSKFKILLIFSLAVALFAPWGCSSDDDAAENPAPIPISPTPQETLVKLETTMGDIVLELFPQQAPITVENFLRYVNEGYYDGTIFHRVISNFMIQGGGIDVDLEFKLPYDPIVNESANGLKNIRGNVAMALSTDIADSATSMFFINVRTNPYLDYKDPTNEKDFGYPVFATVVEGMDVVDQIAALDVTNRDSYFQHLPIQPVAIIKASAISK